MLTELCYRHQMLPTAGTVQKSLVTALMDERLMLVLAVDIYQLLTDLL